MTKIPTLLQVLFVLLLLHSCSVNSQKTIKISHDNFYTPGSQNRTVAEWEPALGTLVVWPLSIPHKLAIELSKDNHLYTMVENEDSKKDAEKWFKEWQIDLKNVTFIFADQGFDAWWTRDWGPSAVFSADKSYSLADGKYIYSTPLTDMACNDSLRFLFYDENNKMILSQTEDDATIPLGKQLGFNVIDLPYNNTGGNVLNDGHGTAFSTCVIKTENKYHGVDFDTFLKLNDSLLGYERYHIISNFEHYGIQHIDCFLKLIDEETILVAEPPADHELFKIYNNIVQNELAVLKTPYGNPYKILRLPTARYRGQQLAAYTNSLILNKTVYVPLFDIPQDNVAIQTWKDAMPGYTVKGFTFTLDEEPIVTEKMRRHYRNYGWNDGDALHCRTRAIWNPEMLFLSVNTVDDIANQDADAVVYTTIIDYSDDGLNTDACELYWRVQGENEWQTIRLSSTDHTEHFYANIPELSSGTTVEYYVSASSKSGEKATRPIAAPIATYSFQVK